MSNNPSWMNTPTVKERLCIKMGWPRAMLADPQFPLREFEIQYMVTEQMLCVCYRKDGVFGYVTDYVKDFPSDELKATLLLLVGPMAELRDRYSMTIRRSKRNW